MKTPTPAPHETTAEVAARLRRAVTRLHRKLRTTADELTPAQASLLASVSVIGSPTLGELAVAEHVQPPTITSLVRVVRAMGLVATRRDGDDRRSTRIEITAKGDRVLSDIRRRKTEYLEARLHEVMGEDDLNPSDVATFLERLLGDS